MKTRICNLSDGYELWSDRHGHSFLKCSNGTTAKVTKNNVKARQWFDIVTLEVEKMEKLGYNERRAVSEALEIWKKSPHYKKAF